VEVKMKLKFYGTRGSLPTPSRKWDEFYTDEFGGNTTCMYVETKAGKFIVDAGTGIAVLGQKVQDEEANLLITHTHWDHIQGFPFFVPAYCGNKINIYGEAKINGEMIDAIRNNDPDSLALLNINGASVKDVMDQQMNPRNFPVSLDLMPGLEFHDFIAGGKIYEKGCVKIETMPVNHPGGGVSYKFTEGKKNPKVLVVCTDFEPDENGYDDELIEWWKGADVVVADGQYEKGSKQNPFMQNYGHSDPFQNVVFAEKAGVPKIIMTHHEPKMDDVYHNDLEQRLQEQTELDVSLAREGMELRI
jgi:phosphoribosyl 1,2-cyclic phosphodiesterase